MFLGQVVEISLEPPLPLTKEVTIVISTGGVQGRRLLQQEEQQKYVGCLSSFADDHSLCIEKNNVLCCRLPGSIQGRSVGCHLIHPFRRLPQPLQLYRLS